MIGRAVTSTVSSGALGTSRADRQHGSQRKRRQRPAACDGTAKRSPRRLAHPARRMPRAGCRAALSSPNSEASCSVIAPASCSASMIVTARR